jgi:ABC-2 type transport system ATP-binding protein
MPDIIEVRDLVKTYGDTRAVDGVSFTVPEGEVFGLLGPNGAGKTTTLSVMSCLLEPTEGDIVVDSSSVRSDPLGVKRALGVVPQDVALYPTLTALENLTFWGRMYGLSGVPLKRRVAEALELAGLADRAKERIDKYSGGMKRRINIAAGVLHHPRVLLMDEPTVGIDPQSRNHILETVRELNRGGMTVVYTSHYMEEVEAICDRVGIVDHGKLIALGTIDELKQVVGGENVISVQIADGAALGGAGESARERAQAEVASVPGVDKASWEEGTLDILARDPSTVLAPVLSALAASDVRVTAVDVREPDLESVFLHLTGKSLRD